MEMLSSMTSSMTSWLGGALPEPSKPAENTEAATDHNSDKNQDGSIPTKTETSAATDDNNTPNKNKPEEEHAEANVTKNKSDPSPATSEETEPQATTQSEHNSLDDVSYLAKEVGSFLFQFGKKATETAVKTAVDLTKKVEEKSILGDFSKEQEKYIQQKNSKRTDASVAPWVGYNEEETLKAQILALSQDQRNFMRNPPSGVQFHFDFAQSYPVALATLAEDKNLQKMRFQLVPKKINEETFWKNYFYRVSLIKQSSELTSLAQETGSSSSKCSSRKSSSSTEKDVTDKVVAIAASQRLDRVKSEDLPAEGTAQNEDFVSDAFQSEINEEELKKGMQQLGMSDTTDGDDEATPEWEKELQRELQDYEVVNDGAEDPEWENEIQQMFLGKTEKLYR